LQLSADIQHFNFTVQTISMNQMYVQSTLNRDMKFLIWNFMEELIGKYHEASRKKASMTFELQDFESVKLPIFTLHDRFMLETLREYERKKKFFQIHDDTAVILTINGLIHAQKVPHDWD
jgi:hypothetical protein